MGLKKVKIGKLEISKLIIGGNTFVGISHKTPAKDLEMKKYFTVAKIKETLKNAEALGISTLISRADNFIVRMLMEYWDEGGKIQWIAQTCPEYGEIKEGIEIAKANGAKACFIHGGTMDLLLAQKKTDIVPGLIKMMRDAGLAAGIGGHNPKVFEWAKDNIDVDFYMACHYNPSDRSKNASHIAGADEKFNNDDRKLMLETLSGTSKPVIHYKVYAAGRNNPEETFKLLSGVVKSNDAVCIGMYPKDKPDMIEENMNLVNKYLK